MTRQMAGVLLVQSGFAMLAAGLLTLAWPLQVLGLTRAHGGSLAGCALLLIVGGALLPARERRVSRACTRLDALSPAWQFRERHALRVAAPPAYVSDAVRAVTAGEIRGFALLTWFRRGGRPRPAGILHAPPDVPIIEVARRDGFLLLADEPPRELVVGTIVIGSMRAFGGDAREAFRTLSAPGFAKATMNFVVEPDARGGSVVTTETRVYATDAASRRRFALYWRAIQPGSAFIRRMWLRAIRDRAVGRCGLRSEGPG